MGQCIAGSVRITTAKEQKTNESFTKSLISAVTRRDVASRIAHDINTGAFYKHFSSDEEFVKSANGSIFNLNRNTFKKYARIYEKQVYPGVTTFAYKGQVNSKGFFDGFDSKNVALNYTGDLIIDACSRFSFNTGITKLRGKSVAQAIKKEVQNQILTELIQRAINTSKQLEKKPIEDKIRELGNKIEHLKAGLKEAQRQRIVAKNNKNADQITLWSDRYLKVQAAIDANIEELLMTTNKLFKEEVDGRTNQNYWALARNVFGENSNINEPYYVDWFRQVGYLPKVFEVLGAFKELYESEKQGTVKNYDDYNLESLMNEDELFSLDSSTAHWSDALYNDFLQHYDNRIKLYLNGLFKLSTTDKVNGQYVYTNEDKLGVRQTMGAGFIIAQLITFGNFSSVNEFIDSVKHIAENIPDCAGLIKLADDMEADRSFANMIASNLAKPAILKNMLIYDGQNFNVVHSNQNAYNSTQIFNRLMGISKITISTPYDESINDKVNDYLQLLNKITNPNYFSDSRTEIGNFILEYFKKYFVGINPDVISNYYYTTDVNEILPRAKRLLEIIGLYNKQIQRVKNDIDKEKERVRLTRKKQKEARETAILSGTYRNTAIYNQPVQFNPDAINYNPIVSVVGQLANLLSGQMSANVELNSGNAENNMSSDIIKNSYITNFLKQLNYILENPDGSENQRGVELLKDFLMKKGNGKVTSYYEYSTILFGIPNPLWRKGSTVPKYLREGLFVKEDNDVVTINPNAKNIINAILFDGAKNTNVRTGQLYQNMSGSDYFTNIVASYFNPINYNREYGDGTKNAVTDYCQILLRIPSDASNQYAIQMPKYKTEGLYNYDTNATKNFVEQRLITPYLSLQGVHAKFTERVAANLYDDYKLNSIFEGKGANIINANQAAQILFDGGIEGNVNLYKYFTQNNGKVLPLLVKDNNNSFIIYLESKDATRKTGKDYKITEIATVDGVRVVKKDPLLMENIVTIQFTPVNEAIRNFFIINNINVTNEFAFDYNGTSRRYNKNSVIYQGFKTQLVGELNLFFNAISDLFESVEDADGNIHYLTKTDTKGLFEYYHYDPKKGIVENGKLTGHVFGFNKLFTVKGYNAGEVISQILNLYGEDGLFKEYSDGRLELNLDRTDLINKDLSGNLNNIGNLFDGVLFDWLDKYAQYIKEESAKYSIVTQRYSQNEIYEAVINQTLAYMEFDDLFEGSSKYYKDAQTFLKRDKEIQAGGQAYMGGVDVSDDIGAPIHDMNDSNGNPIEILITDKRKGNEKYPISTINFVDGDLVQGNLTARNGFRAVTIYNTNTIFDIASTIYDTLKERLEKVEGQTKENAAKIAKNIADGFGYSGSKTKVNDAQSYITFEEFIRRKWMDGTISEYKDLIAKILDENYELTDKDYAEINRKIQVQKNFYYDMAFDINTGVYYPRQIKNAEFVLIPRFIKGTSLEELYNIMKENDINQINTIETSKAANINTLEFWDNNGEAHADKFKEALAATPESIQTYYYRYLYKQQDVVDHIDNEENKAGIQILKKIQDNILGNPNASETVKEAVKTIQDNLTENIKEDYDTLMKACGWHTNENGDLVDDKGQQDIKFDEFYRRAREEASRLGMDSNFLDYITPDDAGNIKMPTFMNNVSSKLESIAQSVFNNAIVRQTLPGFHAVQVTNVGYSRKLRYIVKPDGGVTCEIMVAPWSDEIKQMIAKYGKQATIDKLKEVGADEFIGYRIPTEGKQSIVKMKVVDFLDPSQGSTIIVSNEWVAQTGSDFDVDTVYSIVHELGIDQITKTKKVKKIKKTPEGKDFEVEETEEEKVDEFVIKNKGRAGRNNKILEAFKTILSDNSSFEENMSRSNFDDIDSAIDKYNPTDANASVYDVFSEVRFMENAIAGRKLKAFSVNRDTFNSISNIVHGIIQQSNIKAVYDLSKIDKDNLIAAYGEDHVSISNDGKHATVIHDKIGWSNNNRNVIGKLVTPYSSQTTAHILDAIKKGTIFNETDYTFGSFKTLIDLGIDYDTAVSFLAQQAITDLNNEYFKVNSVFSSTYPTIIENVYRNFAKKQGFTYNGALIGDNTSFKITMAAISGNKEFVKGYCDYWGVTSIDEIPALSEKKFAKELKDKSNNPYHYFGVLQIFNNLKQKTDIIEDIAQCSRPDATGAKQTVRATRKLLDNIREYSTDKEHSIIIGESGNQFLVDLYGLDAYNKVDLEKSKYKYLAAILKYGIETSVTANKRLFLFAGDGFNTLTKTIEDRIGRELNDDEFNLFKKYYVSSLYAGLEFINSPIILDKNNNIISNPNYGTYGPNFWDTERSRVFGYIEPATNGDNFEVSNFGTPTEEDINNYMLLTPVQKVVFLKKTLPYDDNIFNKLYVSKTSDRNYKEKGYTNNKISINIDNVNIESVYQQFRDAFFNDNPLIRLAAIDLVKYAMLVEGYNYKNGAISKIIPNQCLLGEINDRGLDIIQKINDDFVSKLADENEYADKFIRSHSELIRPVKITKPSSKTGETTLGNILNRYREKIDVIKVEGTAEHIDKEYSGYISIPVSEETLDLRNALKLNNNQRAPKYIKLDSATEASGKTTAVLYKIIPIIDNSGTDKEVVTRFNLIPLNLLEENEWADVSINNNNNEFYNYNFYIALHPENKYARDIISPIIMTKDVIDDTANRPEAYIRRIGESKNTDSIETLVHEDKESHKKNLAVHAKKQIVDWYTKDRITYNGADTFGIIQVYGSFAYDVLGIDAANPRKEGTQDIILDDEGTTLTVRITPLDSSNFKRIKAIKNRERHTAATEYINEFAEREDIYYEEKADDKGKIKKIPAGLYKIVPIIKASDEQLLESTDKIEDASPDGLFSKFGGLIDEIRYQTTGIKHIDETHDISTLVMRELQYQKNHGNESVANELGLLSLKGFIPNDSVSLEDYRTDIYKIAAKYYRDAADRIIKRLSNFSCNGGLYPVDDPELYDALRKDPTKVNELYHLVLEASTFGNQISPVMDITYTGEDEETNRNIEKIQRAIKDVRNNNKIHKAFENIYNIYLAKEYSTNPNVRLGVVAMTDIFGDSDWFAANIGDVTHLNHKQIQVVTKIATQELEKARLTAADEIADFEDWWAEMEHMLGKEGMKQALDKIIDKEGKFIQPFTKQYLEDKQAWQEKLAEVEKFGKTSLEYLKVKHQRDKWYLDNVSRQYVKQYYLDKYNNEDYILKASPKAYSEYLTIEAEYFNLAKFATLDDKQRHRKKVLAERMSDMRTDEYLNAFLEKRKDINDKYFEYVESEDFRNTLEKHKEILDRYRQVYKDKTLWEMYTSTDEEFARFRDSYDWIKCNTVYEFSDEAKKAIFNAFAILKTTDDKKKRPIMKVINKFDKDKRLDVAGEIIGTLYSLDDAREIRDIMRRKYSPYGQIDEEGNLVAPPYTENQEAYDSDANLIKDVPETPIFKESLFTDFLLDEDERTTEIRTTKRKLYTKINNIIKKGINNNGEISAEKLVQACTEEELVLLGNLYTDLRTVSKAMSRIYAEDAKETKQTKRPFSYKTNSAAVKKQQAFIVNQSGNIRKALENIFYEKDKDGSILTKRRMPVGNKFIYGYIDLHRDNSGNYTAAAQKYIDKQKTDARKLLNENIVYETTEYYDKAWEAAKLQGEDYFNEWYDANHVYNPYKHQWEPITIWTVMRVNPAGSLKAKADYVANRDNMQKTPKDGTLNPDFDPLYGASYNKEGNYTNEVFKNLTDKEKEILKKLQDVAANYAINNNQKRFLSSGFAPRVYEKNTDWVDTLNDAANVFGLGNRSSIEKDWHQDVDFEHDFDIEFSMYKLLKAEGYQKPPVLRKQAALETDAEYAKYKEDWKKQVKEVNEANFKLDNAVFSRNWKEVYKRLIEEGNQYTTKTRMKDLLYLTLQDLRQREAYATTQRYHSIGDLIKRGGTSTRQQEDFYKTDQNRTIDTFQNWIRRYLYDEYKNYTVFNKVADRIQTMNSAKFMMFNLMSGINNVSVGLVNMAMEGFAGDYFSHAGLTKGMTQYMLNVGAFATHFATGVATNETVALLEMFNVEDYDRSQAAFQDFKTNAINKFNDVAYGFLSSGEHFMRSSAMLAMLESHRLYKDSITGKWVVGTEKDYLQGLEIAAIENTLKQLAEEYKNENSEDANFYLGLADYFHNTYIPEIRDNKREAIKFDRLQKDILNGFIRSSEFNRYGTLPAAARKKKFVQTYLSVKKDLLAKGKKDFAKEQTVKENLYYDAQQKRERIVKDSHLTRDHVAEIITRAKSVNKKIHGVYDKLGAAKIERYTLGALIMQYKKHLYPGFMKHWRKKGYYNELRGTNEYGVFQSLFDWLVQDFRYKDSINNVFNAQSNSSDEESSQWAAMNIFEKLINNALDLGINWQMLPDWQKRNVIRLSGDIGGILVALGIIMAIYALMDDDDLKKSKLANEALYLADRLYGESTMYGVILSGGLWTEFSNFKEKPIVAMDFIYDAFKMKDYVFSYAFDHENYEPNYKRGTYKGENKMWVVLRRNIPGWRQYSQWKHITSHNNYYKVNESNFGQTLFKNIGKSIRGEDIKEDRENKINSGLGLINR